MNFETPQIPTEEKSPVRPVGHGPEFLRLKGQSLGDSEPEIIDTINGADLNPELDGTKYNLYRFVDQDNHDRELVGVGMDGLSAPWAGQLGSKVFESVEDAREWLKREATK